MGCDSEFTRSDFEEKRRRPNHFFHDSLGCPYECEEDHNHPMTER